MRNVVVLMAWLIVVATLAGCGKHADEGAKQTVLKVEENKSGAAPVEPSRNKLVVLAPPSAPQIARQEGAKLAAERDKVEARIHGLMNDYSNNLRNPKSRAKYQEQIAQQLDTYKRQNLELFKLQQQVDAAEAAAH